MHEENEKNLQGLIKEREEAVSLLLEKSIGSKRFRYAVGKREVVLKEEEAKELSLGSSALAPESAPRTVYSVYAEYEDDGIHTVGKIPDFSYNKETAEGFCRLLAGILATPLSLEALYEDSLTP